MWSKYKTPIGLEIASTTHPFRLIIFYQFFHSHLLILLVDSMEVFNFKSFELLLIQQLVLIIQFFLHSQQLIRVYLRIVYVRWRLPSPDTLIDRNIPSMRATVNRWFPSYLPFYFVQLILQRLLFLLEAFLPEHSLIILPGCQQLNFFRIFAALFSVWMWQVVWSQRWLFVGRRHWWFLFRLERGSVLWESGRLWRLLFLRWQLVSLFGFNLVPT